MSGGFSISINFPRKTGISSENVFTQSVPFRWNKKRRQTEIYTRQKSQTCAQIFNEKKIRRKRDTKKGTYLFSSLDL